MAKNDHAAPGKDGGELDKKKNGRPCRRGRTKSTSDMQLHVVRQLLDHVPLQKSPGPDPAGSGSGSREVGFGTEAGELVMVW